MCRQKNGLLRTLACVITAGMLLPVSAASAAGKIKNDTQAQNGVLLLEATTGGTTTHAACTAIGEQGKPVAYVISAYTAVYGDTEAHADTTLLVYDSVNPAGIAAEPVYSDAATELVILRLAEPTEARTALAIWDYDSGMPEKPEATRMIGYLSTAEPEAQPSFDAAGTALRAMPLGAEVYNDGVRCWTLENDFGGFLTGGPVVTENGVLIGISTGRWTDNGSADAASFAVCSDSVIRAMRSCGIYITLSGAGDDGLPVVWYVLLGLAIFLVLFVLIVIIVKLTRRHSLPSDGLKQKPTREKRRKKNQKNYTLVGIHGRYTAEHIPVAGRMKLGSNGTDCNLIFPESPVIAGLHCTLSCSDDTLLVVACSAEKPTLVNGTAIAVQKPIPLQNGDTLSLGDRLQSFRVETDE